MARPSRADAPHTAHAHPRATASPSAHPLHRSACGVIADSRPHPTQIRHTAPSRVVTRATSDTLGITALTSLAEWVGPGAGDVFAGGSPPPGNEQIRPRP